MAGRVAQAMKQASREATILLYAPVLERHLEAIAAPTASSASMTYSLLGMHGIDRSQKP